MTTQSKSTPVTTPTTEDVHVTAIRDGGLFGHSAGTCDEAGCAGHEVFWGDCPEDAEVNDVIEVTL